MSRLRLQFAYAVISANASKDCGRPALAERFVRTVRTECLDWTLVLGRRHLEAVLREYITLPNDFIASTAPSDQDFLAVPPPSAPARAD